MNYMDLDTEIRSILKLYKELISGADQENTVSIEYRTDLTPGDYKVFFDKSLFRSVIVNLISCTRSTLKANNYRPCTIVIETKNKKNVWGSGIIYVSVKNYLPKDDDNDMSCKFLRVESTANDNLRKESTPLPMIFKNDKAAKAKEIVIKHGGMLWLKNNFLIGRGGGLSFEFTMIEEGRLADTKPEYESSIN